MVLCYESAYLFTFELFLELRIVRVLETALANQKGNGNNNYNCNASRCSNCERIRIKVRFLHELLSEIMSNMYVFILWYFLVL